MSSFAKFCSVVSRRIGRMGVLLMCGGLLTGCLATAVTNLSQSFSDAVAPKVNFLIPPKSAEAGTLKSVLIASDNSAVSQQVALGFESQMSKLRVNERPFYTSAKLGPRLNGQPTDAQLISLAKTNSVAGVLILTGGSSNVKNIASTEDRYSCAVDTKLFKSCPKGQSRTTKVSCTTTQGSATVRLRVFRLVDGRVVFADTVSGEFKTYRCDDDQTQHADASQVAYGAVLNATENAMRILAPSYDLRPLDIMSADAALPPAKRVAFDAAIDFAKAKRMDEACSRFEEIYLDFKESIALTFNVAFCQEVRGDLLRANQGYRRASELANAPEVQIDRRLALTEKALRENPVAFMPTSDASVVPSSQSVQVGGVIGDRRVALVIGNARYQRSALINPVNDARLVSDQLKRIGFDVITLENVESARFDSATREFAKRAKGADVALFYYAGHALQADGENYLMPVDNQKMQTMEDVRDGGGVQLAGVVAQLEVAAPVVKLVVIDACRDNPLPSANRSLAGGGLAAVAKPPQGGLIAFATSPGRTAEDGVGKNSVFSKHFAAQVAKPNQTIEQLFKHVREAVKRETKSRQEPMETSNLIGELMLVKGK